MSDRTNSAINMLESTERAVTAVVAERDRQDTKWGEQNHVPTVWMTVLTEEVGEVAQQALRAMFSREADDRRAAGLRYREELVQVAAVAMAAIESFDRNEGREASS